MQREEEIELQICHLQDRLRFLRQGCMAEVNRVREDILNRFGMDILGYSTRADEAICRNVLIARYREQGFTLKTIGEALGGRTHPAISTGYKNYMAKRNDPKQNGWELIINQIIIANEY